MKKIHIVLIVFVSFVVIVFVNSYIPRSYHLIEQKDVSIDFEKRLDILNENLNMCKDEKNPRLIAECEYPIKNEIKILEFKQKSKIFVVGPIAYYYAGGMVDVSAQGTAVFNLKMLAENTGSSDTVLLHCGGAASCNYHIWDGKTTYIHSSHDFTAGSVAIKPGQAKFFNILFGPAQGYGNYVDFEYDPSKDYFLRIEEPFGSADIPLELH
jgi:hypothetical protein